MNATVTPVDQHKVTLTIEVPAKDVTKGIQQAVKRIAGQVIFRASVKVKHLAVF